MIKPEDLTDAEIRAYLAWLLAGNYRLGEGPRAGLEKREVMAACVSALNPRCREDRRAEARGIVCAAIAARAASSPNPHCGVAGCPGGPHHAHDPADWSGTC